VLCTIWKCMCAKWSFWHMPCFVEICHPFLHQHIVPPSIATSGDVRWVNGWERLCQMCLFAQNQTQKPCEAIKDHSLPQNPPMSSLMNVNRAICGKPTPLTITNGSHLIMFLIFMCSCVWCQLHIQLSFSTHKFAILDIYTYWFSLPLSYIYQ